jgi:hypothetical protein
LQLGPISVNICLGGSVEALRIVSDVIVGTALAVDLPATSQEEQMLSVKPGQNWERRSISGAPWRPIEVVNVLADTIELRFLDMPDAPDLQRVFSTKVEQMLLSPDHRQGPEYRFIRDPD